MKIALDPFMHRHLSLADVGFDGIMTACVFAWEDKADESGKFMRAEMQRDVEIYWKR